METESLYQQLKAAGVPMDHHESDLYCLRTPDSTEIIKGTEYRSMFRTFTDRVDGSEWYEIPFAYDPFWEAKV